VPSDTDDEVSALGQVGEDELLEGSASAAEIPDAEAAAASTGYLSDYISGKRIRATPEEVEAVQVFSQRLVEDYEYPRKHIQTRPQFRVRKRPSDETKTYPIDVAVFS